MHLHILLIENHTLFSPNTRVLHTCCYVFHMCLWPTWQNGSLRVKFQGKVSETKATNKTLDRTTVELMFYHVHLQYKARQPPSTFIILCALMKTSAPQWQTSTHFTAIFLKLWEKIALILHWTVVLLTRLNCLRRNHRLLISSVKQKTRQQRQVLSQWSGACCSFVWLGRSEQSMQSHSGRLVR